MRKKTDYLQMDEIINKYYIDAADVSILANCNIKYARAIVNRVAREMVESGYQVHVSRPMLVPTKRVLKYLGIDSKVVRKEAENIRKSTLSA